jgi:hypothetical protein
MNQRCGPPKRIVLCETGDARTGRGRKSSTSIGTDGARVLVRKVRWQKSVRRISASRPERSRKANLRSDAGPGAIRTRADAGDGGSGAKAVRAVTRYSPSNETSVARRPGRPGRARHDGRRPGRRTARFARDGRHGGLGRAGQRSDNRHRKVRVRPELSRRSLEPASGVPAPTTGDVRDRRRVR